MADLGDISRATASACVQPGLTVEQGLAVRSSIADYSRSLPLMSTEPATPSNTLFLVGGTVVSAQAPPADGRLLAYSIPVSDTTGEILVGD